MLLLLALLFQQVPTEPPANASAHHEVETHQDKHRRHHHVQHFYMCVGEDMTDCREIQWTPEKKK